MLDEKQMILVEGSSNIKKIGYDLEQQLLQVEFLNSRVYIYTEVDADIFAGLKNADSKGKFMNEHIYGKYKYVRI